MTQTIEQLQAKVAELEEENARLKAECDDIKQVQFPRKLEAVAVGWKKQLAASQAYAEQLREALSSVEWEDFHFDHHGNGQQHCPGCGNQKSVGRHTIQCPIGKALALPRDTSALDAYVAEKVKEAVKEADDQILAAKNLLAIMHRDGGHHEFAVGFDQAIQDAMAVYYELTRQRDLAVEAITRAIDMVGHPDNITYLQQTLDAIKESEAK